MEAPMTAPALHPLTRCAPAEGRALLRVAGPDRVKFLQGLVTQDMGRVVREGIGYAALLTPQGKLIADFFLVTQGDALLIDVAEPLAADLAKRLTMFKLRAAVTIEAVTLPVTRGLGPVPEGALADPRDPSLGWRLYGQALSVGLTVQDVQDWPEVLQSITEDEVMAAARDVLNRDNAVTGWLTHPAAEGEAQP